MALITQERKGQTLLGAVEDQTLLPLAQTLPPHPSRICPLLGRWRSFCPGSPCQQQQQVPSPALLPLQEAHSPAGHVPNCRSKPIFSVILHSSSSCQALTLHHGHMDQEAQPELSSLPPREQHQLMEHQRCPSCGLVHISFPWEPDVLLTP